jgi:hypothetical protein
MSVQAVLGLVEKLAMETPFPGTSLQVAFVRALVDELERYHPADAGAAPLREQLGDELARLVQLIERSLGVPPDTVPGRSVDELEARLVSASRLVRSVHAVEAQRSRMEPTPSAD